jgi:L-lactate dehydrogenase complex protein LldG
MSGREAVLSAVRGAMSGDKPAHVAPSYRHVGDMSPAARRDRFLSRLDDYNVHVVRVADASGIADAVAERLGAAGSTRCLVPADLPSEWRPSRIEVLEDSEGDPLPHTGVEAAPSVVTGCAVAIAEIGAVALDAGARQGRRLLTLLPDHHVCVVFEHQLVELLPEALAALKPAAQAGRPVTVFAGPSATADIEFDRVVGVHGPRRLDVVFVDGPA